MRNLYGPVESWRFGRSLGVDPLAARGKMCPFSCIYCQYGETRHPTTRRRTWVTAEQLEAQVERLGPLRVDSVTFAGLGEPTLAANLAELVIAMRRHLDAPSTILTGSALLARADVRRDLERFDTVVAKLDAPDEALFRRINRPCSAYRMPLQGIVEGLGLFRKVFAGRFVLQIMFVQANLHAAPQLAALAGSLEPDEIQLNTPLQPALGGPISETEMGQVRSAFAGLPVRSVYKNGQAQIRARLP
jgi:wyosine [tRNA(Phe)-imidazoG37] synthetase (radical SAM superfamily)